MAVDISKVTKKVQEEKARASRTFERVRFWKAKNGDNLIRLMPPWTDEGPNANVFWREVYTHWNIGQGGFDEENGMSYTCPVKTPDGPGGTCEVCELAKQFKDSGDPADSAIAKELFAKRRTMTNIVDLNDPVFTEDDLAEWKEGRMDSDQAPFNVGDTKVQVWTYSTTIFKELLDYFADGLDLTSFVEGYNLVITKEAATSKEAFTKYRTRLKPPATKFNFKGDVEKLVYNLDALLPFPEEGAMRKALAGESVRGKLPSGKNVPSLSSGDTTSADLEDAVRSIEEEMAAAMKG